MHQPSPGRSSSSSSPDLVYPPSDHHLVSLQSQGQQGLSNPPNYNYRSGTTTYQEQSQGPGYTYVHTTPITQPPSGSSNGNSFSSYSNSPDNFNVSPIQQNQNDHRDNSPVSISSRHSISHISHPQSSYQSSSTSPSSPASSHSHHSGASGPPTPTVPTYSAFHDDTHPYHQHSHHGNGMVNNDHQQQQHPHSHSQSHILPQQNGNNYHSYGRFDSPPLTLAPIQGERLIRRDDSRHSQNHNYIHAQSVGDYPYHQGMGLGHGAWKAESGMRKGLGAALVWMEDSLFCCFFSHRLMYFLWIFLYPRRTIFTRFLVTCHILRFFCSSFINLSSQLVLLLSFTLLLLAPYLTYIEVLGFCVSFFSIFFFPALLRIWIPTKNQLDTDH